MVSVSFACDNLAYFLTIFLAYFSSLDTILSCRKIALGSFTDVGGGAGLISQALLANADALCAAVSPLMDPDETLMFVNLMYIFGNWRESSLFWYEKNEFF